MMNAEQLDCTICTKKFDLKIRKKLVLSCGHAFCIFCIGCIQREALQRDQYHFFCPDDDCAVLHSFVHPLADEEFITADPSLIAVVHREAESVDETVVATDTDPHYESAPNPLDDDMLEKIPHGIDDHGKFEPNAKDDGREVDKAPIMIPDQSALPPTRTTRKIRVAILFYCLGGAIESLVKAGRQEDSPYEVVALFFFHESDTICRKLADKLTIPSYCFFNTKILKEDLKKYCVDILCMDTLNPRIQELVLEHHICVKVIHARPSIDFDFWNDPFNGPIAAGRRVTGCAFYRLKTLDPLLITIVDEEAVRVHDRATPAILKGILTSAVTDSYPRAVTRLAKQIISANMAQ